MNYHECIIKQTNLPKFTDDIMYYILSFIGNWRYCYEKNEIIVKINDSDPRYYLLNDFYEKRNDFFYEQYYTSSRLKNLNYRIGYNIPIKELKNLPSVYELIDMYGKDECYDYIDKCIPKFNKNCKRYLKLELKIYNIYTKNKHYIFRTHVSKYDYIDDSSDSDIDYDENRSSSKFDYI
jgi:hypothetical protein